MQIHIDYDVLGVLKADGHGYQTRINAILRQAVFG
ncbi:MAG: BrnA antitoxin family protein [Sphaerochaetaceae bacterium]|nr:BrnA antitoxin family protein [Sphaerochaetaceae bacterium]